MENEIDAWYEEDDLTFLPMRRVGSGQEYQQAHLLLKKHLQNPRLVLARNVPLHGGLVALPALQTLHPTSHVRVLIEGDLAPLLKLAQPHEVAGVGYIG